MHNAIEAVPNGWRRFFGWIYIYIYVLQKKKWGKIGPSFSMPNCWCFFPCHPSDVGETMPVRCTCLGRGGCFGLWGICELYLGAQAEPVFFYVWSSNTWHILTNGGRYKSYNKKKYREATALTLPLSSPLRPARGITNHGLPGLQTVLSRQFVQYISNHTDTTWWNQDRY